MGDRINEVINEVSGECLTNRFSGPAAPAWVQTLYIQ
jgi:hypothetical protein